jgi:hypothetical protein
MAYRVPTPTYSPPIGSTTCLDGLLASRSDPSSFSSVADRRWRKITQPSPHLTTGSTTFQHPRTPTPAQHFTQPGKSASSCLDASSSPQRMEVQIPSPTVFLQRSPVIEPAPAPIGKQIPKPRAAASNHTKKASNASTAAAQASGITKPKQTKSRNGMYKCSRCVRRSAHRA